jgi:hypothetical protein
MRSCLALTARANDWVAWLLWVTLFAVVSLNIALGSKRSVTHNYRTAAVAWQGASELYLGQGTGFIYLPQAAITFVPFACLPQRAGDIAWRLFTVGMFSWGVWRLSDWVGRESGTRLFPLASLVSIPLAWSASRNGQSTLPMAATMMLAVVAIGEGAWNRATLWLMFGLMLKPLTLPLILVSVALYPAMRHRIALALLMVFLIPFALQRPTYVLQQYVSAVEMFRVASRVGDDGYWAQLFGMLKIVHLNVPPVIQNVLRVLAAAVTFVACWTCKRHLSETQIPLATCAIVIIYTMLFNPRTENNTYAMMGPILGLYASQCFFVWGNRRLGYLVLACGATILGSYELGRVLLPDQAPIWMAPLACIVFVPVLTNLLVRYAHASCSRTLRCTSHGVESSHIGARVRHAA